MPNSRLGIFRHLSAAAVIVCGVAVLSTTASAQMSGVENFHQVNEHVYRGAQPTTEGFQQLAKLGVKTIVDLRETDSRSTAEKKVVEANGMRYVNIPLRGMSAPSPADVAKVLALFDDPSAGPVFVHCRRGADRTGTVVACYRISHDGWDKSRALSEAKSNGMSWTEVSMRKYVKHYRAPQATPASAVTQ